MRFKVGEKVKLLNEKGGGKVKRIQADGMVVVEVDGFDIPYHPSELVKLETSDEPETVTVPEPVKSAERAISKPIQSKTAKQLPEGVYLAFIPENENKLLECPIEVTLYNKTSYNLYYTLLQKEVNKFFCAALGEIKPKASEQLLKVLRSELEALSLLRFQGLKFKKGELEPQEPLNITIKLKPVKFYKETSYQFIHELGTKAFLVDLSGKEIEIEEEKPKPIPSTQGMLGRQLAKEMASKKRLDKELRKAVPIVLEEEVDLHIEELLDDHRGMSNGEIIQIQLKHFQRKLDEAIAKHLIKITFIHGVGTGRLKEEILKLLKEYRNIEYRNAPYEKYGYGATEVIIK